VIGGNANGNLNILIFEVGMVTTLEALGSQASTTSTVSVHPLLVAPQRIRYTDSSRSSVTQTARGSVKTQGGRALRTVSLEGTFGVDSRGLGPYIGTGEVRFKRFYNEVVRMSGAMSQEDVDAAVDPLTGTPGIPLFVGLYSEDDTLFYVNFYDFFNGEAFEAEVQSFVWTREHRNGGASGMVTYSMTLQEVGALVEGGLGNTIISALMAALGLWSGITGAIASYTPTAIVGAFVGVAAIAVSQATATIRAVEAQVEGIRALLGGQGVPGLLASNGEEGLASFLRNCEAMALACDELSDSLSRPLGGQTQAGRGRADLSGAEGSTALARYEQQTAMRGLADYARQQLVMGIYFGLSRQQFQEWVAAGGGDTALPPDVRGSIRHVVSDADTPATIEALYGVPFSRILTLLRLTPDEALFPGRVLQIPTRRARGPQGIRGLPTFGSHVGRAAWGSDLPLELSASGGRLRVVSAEDVLAQGVTFLVEVFGDNLLRDLQTVPDVARASYLTRRVAGIMKSDQRVSAVSGVEVQEGARGLSLTVTLQAINGGTVRAAGSFNG
jgi:hypothetical protein